MMGFIALIVWWKVVLISYLLMVVFSIASEVFKSDSSKYTIGLCSGINMIILVIGIIMMVWSW